MLFVKEIVIVNGAVLFALVTIKYLLVSTSLNNSANLCGNLLRKWNLQIDQGLPVRSRLRWIPTVMILQRG